MENQKVTILEKGCDPVSCLNNSGIQRLQHDIGDTNRDVKDSEAQIRYGIKDSEADIRYGIKDSEADVRHDILFEGQENLRTTERSRGDVLLKIQESECSVTKEVLETKHSLAKDILKSEYENKLAIKDAINEIKTNAQHNAERTQDKAYHYFEELNEKIEACCCDTQLNFANQQGLLDRLVSGLLK